MARFPGLWQAYIDSYWLFNLQCSIFPDILSASRHLLNVAYAMLLHPTCVAMWLLAGLTVWHLRSSTQHRLTVMLAATMLATDLVTVGLSGAPNTVHNSVCTLFLAPLLALLLDSLRSQLDTTPLRASRIRLSLCGLVVAALASLTALQLYRGPKRQERARESLALAQWVEEHTYPDDCISQFDTHDISLYVLAHRRSASRFFFIWTIFDYAPETFAGWQDDVRRNRPRVIVARTAERDGTPELPADILADYQACLGTTALRAFCDETNDYLVSR